MDYGFTQNDVLLIYVHFVEEIKKLEALCNATNAAASLKKDVQKSIKQYTSITDKLRAKHPRLDFLAR